MPDTTYYTSCLRIERTDGFVICLTDLDKDLTINDSAIGLSGGDQIYLAAAGYTPTNMQSTSDNAVNNADVEGVLSAAGVQREDIIGGRYDFAKLHFFLWDWNANTLVKKLGAGHWGEVTIKDSSYVAEFRSLSQQLQQTIGRTYNPECDEQLGGTRCTVQLDDRRDEDGLIDAVYSYNDVIDSTLTQVDNHWNGGVLTWTSGLNDTISSLVSGYLLSNTTLTLTSTMGELIASGDTYDLTKEFENSTTTADGLVDGTTLIDTTLTEADNFYNGMDVTIGLETRAVTSFVNATGVITVSPAFTAQVTTSTAYTIDDNFTGSATSGSSLTVIEDSTVTTSFAGLIVVMLSGANIGEFRTISSSGAGIITVSSAFTNLLGTDDTFEVIALTDYMALATVTSVVDNANFTVDVTVNGTLNAAMVTDYFNYGKLKFKGGLNYNLHMEVKKSTNNGGVSQTIQMFLPMSFEVAVGDTFEMFAGCDKRLTTCKTKFNNLINFQGFPYIPGADAVMLFGGQ